jgi:hypothetical protein
VALAYAAMCRREELVSLLVEDIAEARGGMAQAAKSQSHRELATETRAPCLVSGRRVGGAPLIRRFERGQAPEQLDQTKNA